MKALLKALLILLMASTLATQVFAVQWHTSPSLGAPAFLVGDFQFYMPWQGVQWCAWWCGTSPHLFLWAGVTAGGMVLLMSGLWVYVAVTAAQRQQRGGFATPRQLRKVKVLRNEGIVVGKLP